MRSIKIKAEDSSDTYGSVKVEKDEIEAQLNSHKNTKLHKNSRIYKQKTLTLKKCFNTESAAIKSVVKVQRDSLPNVILRLSDLYV